MQVLVAIIVAIGRLLQDVFQTSMLAFQQEREKYWRHFAIFMRLILEAA